MFVRYTLYWHGLPCYLATTHRQHTYLLSHFCTDYYPDRTNCSTCSIFTWCCTIVFIDTSQGKYIISTWNITILYVCYYYSFNILTCILHIGQKLYIFFPKMTTCFISHNETMTLITHLAPRCNFPTHLCFRFAFNMSRYFPWFLYYRPSNSWPST